MVLQYLPVAAWKAPSRECVQRSAAVALSAKTPAVLMELPVKEAHSRWTFYQHHVIIDYVFLLH